MVPLCYSVRPGLMLEMIPGEEADVEVNVMSNKPCCFLSLSLPLLPIWLRNGLASYSFQEQKTSETLCQSRWI